MSQLQLRIVIPDKGPGVVFAAECDYCGKVARVRLLGADCVCDKCLGVVEQGEAESEVEQCRR